jgi:pimeloyl-ACP methyl ester carboxylesterase
MARVVSWLVGSLLLLVALALVALAGFWGWSQLRESRGRVTAAPKDGQFVYAGDVQLFTQQAGPKDGAVVVLVGGPGAWSETWRPSINALADAGYRVFALDLPPFGYSFRPANGDYSTEAQARRVLGVIDSLGVTSAVLIGHSFGARAAVEAAMSAPHRASALVLVSPALGLQTPPGEDPGVLIGAVLKTPPLRNAAMASVGTNPMVTVHLLKAVTAKHESLTDARVAVFQRPLSVTGTTEASGRWLHQVMMSEERPASRQPQRYRDLGIPLLLIWGDADTVTPPAQGQFIASLVPGAQLVTMPGVGHIPQLEDDAAFNAVLLANMPVAAVESKAAPDKARSSIKPR